MKKLLMLLVTVFTVTSLFSQQNVVKLGLGSGIVQRDINLKYERAFAENHSFQVSVIWDTPEKYDLGNYTAEPDAAGVEATLGGFAIVPEYRYYFGKNGAPRGFYAGVYARYRSRNLSFVNDFGSDVEVDAKFNLRNFGGGIGCGVQWLIKDAFAIDWYIFGIGYNAFGLNFTLKPTDPADFAELKNSILEEIDNVRDQAEIPDEVAQSDEFALLLDEFEKVVENTSDDTVFKSPRIPLGLIDFRTGLSIGYAF